MLVVVISSLLAILLAFFSKYKSTRKGLEWAFVIVTIIACLHYDYGNDYMGYYYGWQSYRNYSFANIFDFEVNFEPGWILLNWLFRFDNGFFILVALLNIVQNIIYYKLIKTYVPRNWFWLAMFIYLCSTNYYLINFSMMRQGLTIALCVSSFFFLRERRILPALLLVLFSITVHRTSILFLPFVFAGFFPLNNTRPYAVVIILITIVLFFYKDVVGSIFENIMTVEEFDKYNRAYAGNTSKGVNTGLGVIPNHLQYFVMIYFMLVRNKEFSRDENMLLIILSYLDLLLVPFSMVGAAIIGRLGYYFGAFQIASIPILYSRIKTPAIRQGLTLIFIFMILVGYIGFLLSDNFHEPYSTFHTFFEALQ